MKMQLLQRKPKKEQKAELKVKYKARTGATFSDSEAEMVGRELEKIKAEEGFLNPVVVLEHAKQTNSPLFKFFEWDKNKASYQYNLQQARGLVHNLIRIVIIDSKPVQIKAFYSVQDNSDKQNPQRVYASVEEVNVNKNYKKEVFDRAISELNNVQSLLVVLRNME